MIEDIVAMCAVAASAAKAWSILRNAEKKKVGRGKNQQSAK